MPRSRNIKPGFFENEHLGTLPSDIQLLFIALWTLADREGIIEYRVSKIRTYAFRYRPEITDEQVNGYITVLQRLDNNQVLKRVSYNQKEYLIICNFLRHQSPHKTENKGNLPTLEALKAAPNLDSSCHNGYLTVKQPLDNRYITEPERPDSLIPDSLIPDLLIEEKKEKYKKEKSLVAIQPSSERNLVVKQSSNEVSEVFDFWKTTLGHSQARLDDKRKKLIQARLKEGYTIEDLKKAILGCKQSAFHQGHNEQGKIYDSIDLIFRDAGKVDHFIQLYEKPQLPKTEGQLNSEKETLQSMMVLEKIKRERHG